MRFKKFAQSMRSAKAGFGPAPSWKQEGREALLAEIRKSEAWQKAPISADNGASFSQAFHAIFAKAMLKPAIAVLLVFSVVSWSSVATVSAARASLPGDTLYGVKLGMEAAQQAVAFSESKKAQLEISFATTRLAEVSEIIKQDKEGASAPHITQAIQRFNSDMESVQKRLEKMDQSGKYEEKVLKLSQLVNNATQRLEEDLLDIKEQLAEQKPEPAAVSEEPQGATPPQEAAQSEDAESDSGDAQSSAASTTPEVAATASTTPEKAAQPEEKAEPKAANGVLAALEGALDAVDNTNIASLEVFVDKAKASKSQETQQEAVDKIQRRIERIEKNIATTISENKGAQQAVETVAAEGSEQDAPKQQIQEALSQARQILETKNINQLGEVVEKVKEVRQIVKDAAQAATDAETEKQNQDTQSENPSTSATSTGAVLGEHASAGNATSTATSVPETIEKEVE